MARIFLSALLFLLCHSVVIDAGPMVEPLSNLPSSGEVIKLLNEARSDPARLELFLNQN